MKWPSDFHCGCPKILIKLLIHYKMDEKYVAGMQTVYTLVCLLRPRSITMFQGCHGQGKKSGKGIFFQVREKSGNFNFSQGNLEKVV